MKLGMKHFIVIMCLLLVASSLTTYIFLKPVKNLKFPPLPVSEAPVAFLKSSSYFSQLCMAEPCEDTIKYDKGFYQFCSQKFGQKNAFCSCKLDTGDYQVASRIKFISKLSSVDSIWKGTYHFKSLYFYSGFSFNNIKDTNGSEHIGSSSFSIDGRSSEVENVDANNFNFENCDFFRLSINGDAFNGFNLSNSILRFLNITTCSDNYQKRQFNHYDSILVFTPWNDQTVNHLDKQNGYFLYKAYITQLNFTNNNISYLSVSHSKLEALKIDSLFDNGRCIKFSEDSLADIKIDNSFASETSTYHCTFSGKIDIRLGEKCNLVFNDCSFTNQAEVINVTSGNLYFDNCKNFAQAIRLETDSSRLVKLNFDNNTDLSKLNFFYNDNYQIVYNRYESADENYKLFDRLRTKFKSEYKSADLERIQIEYTRYNYSKDWWKYPLWLIDWAWWDYGFAKGRIVLWTLVFFTLFYALNFKHWRRISKAYEIFPNIPDWKKYKKQKYYYVFLFTAFIFFSIRIDLQSLKYDNKRTLSHFFVQYLVGLICLFFLFNAIFKLS